jgi:DNA invertase Pin-like site-specific DNA recombinase
MSDKLYNVGIYIRLSKEVTRQTRNDSMSIETQQAMLSKFVSLMPGWIEKRIYIDEGASGGNFNRQGFQDMMNDIKSGVINLVLVKDLSRFGRNYLEAGRYLEEELPALGCRFVALSDGIDTENGENDIMPFLNAMNDHYLKNMSDKIKASFVAMAKNGQRSVGIAPFGYMRNPADRSRIIVDEVAAEVVNRIYCMRAEGMGYNAITKILNDEQIPPPRLYYFQRQNRKPQSNCQTDWQIYMVKRLLVDEQYLGHTIFGKTRSISYRNTHQVPNGKDDWIKVENTHPAIIEQAVWGKVQKLHALQKEASANRKKPVPSLFQGKLVCSDCQKTMVFHANHAYRTKGIDKYNMYCCRTHMNTGGSRCSSHNIYDVALQNLLLSDIKRHEGLIRLDESKMLSSLMEKLTGGHSEEKAVSAKERQKLKQELHDTELRTEILYDNKVSGVLTGERFAELVAVSETRRSEIQNLLNGYEEAEKEAKVKLADIERWLSLIKEKSSVAEVSRDLIDALVDRIEIGKKTKENKVVSQEVKIFYRFVGLV